MQVSSRLLNRKVSYRIALLLCGVVVISWLAWGASDDLAVVLKNVRLGYLLGAILIGIFFTFSYGVLFSQLMKKNGSKADTRDLVAAFFLSQPGKYIPGKIWPAIMQSLALKSPNSFAGIAIANVELVAIAITQMTTLGITCLWLHHPLFSLISLVFGLTLSAAIILLPTTILLHRISSRLTTLLRVCPPEKCNQHSPFWSAFLLSGAAIGFNLTASLWVLFAAGPSINQEAYAPILAALYLAFAASLLVVPIPAGVGVREAATVGVGFMVAPEIPSAMFISIALLTRCWQLLVDAACLGLGTIMLAVSPTAKK